MYGRSFRQKTSTRRAVLADVGGGLPSESKQESDDLGADDIVEVTNMRGAQGGKLAIEPPKAEWAGVMALVDRKIVHIGREATEDVAKGWRPGHGDGKGRILASQSIHDGDGHKRVAQGREADEEQVTHFFLLL